MSTLKIGELSHQTGLPPKTIRYYESVGLIPAAVRGDNGYRYYGEKDVRTLRFVQRARSLGFSVDDVGGLLALWGDRDRASADVKALALRHAQAIEQKISELEHMRAAVLDLAERCHGDARPECPILEGLAREGAG